jgi:hypothetical protein
MTAQGNEDQAHKGRDAIIASVIGIIIIMGSYTLVQFVFSTVENTGSNKEIKTDTCSEYNPNWSCMDISQCAGATNNKDLVARNDCTPEKNCSINECLSNDDGNYVCCLPYKSFCEINYSGYSCIDDEEKCTSGVVSALAEEPSLCDTEKGDVGNFCCESRVVWSFDKDNTSWSDELGKEGQLEKFACVSSTGKFSETDADFLGANGNNVWDNIINKNSSLPNSELGKYQFDSEEECQKMVKRKKYFV